MIPSRAFSTSVLTIASGHRRLHSLAINREALSRKSDSGTGEYSLCRLERVLGLDSRPSSGSIALPDWAAVEQLDVAADCSAVLVVGACSSIVTELQTAGILEAAIRRMTCGRQGTLQGKVGNHVANPEPRRMGCGIYTSMNS